ncbi:tetratricopeptide repeat protein [bacterium]|nr:tetratricopeptide repeat protein [bacterium]QQR58388.1 MAG: tetratricopeptide repeat protein [Candidatus Melainabacteria bacterium]
MKRVSLALAASLLVIGSVSVTSGLNQAFAEERTSDTKSQAPVIAPSSEACLEKVRGMAETFPKMAEAGKEAVRTMIPDPAEFEKKLPAIEEVLKNKDAMNLKNYGGLSEAYLFKGDEEKAEKLLKSVSEGAKEILPENDNFLAAVKGDFGLAYYLNNKYDKAETYLGDAVSQLEKHYQPALANNLVASYLCMTIIKDKQGKTEEAKGFAKKLVVLALKLRQEQPLPIPTTEAPAQAVPAEKEAAAK